MNPDSSHPKPTTIDLFSGAGGTGYGFQRAGFEILAAIELDKHAAATYKYNLGVDVTVKDMRPMSPTRFRQSLELEPGKLDVLVGCPPCQGFTRMRNASGSDDFRNTLVLKYLKFVRELLPRFAVFENVPGILRTGHGKKFYEQLLNGLGKPVHEGGLGYNVISKEVDAADYGVPQHRKRIIIVAGRDGEEPPFPTPTHADPRSNEVKYGRLRPWLTVREVLMKYPRLSAGEAVEDQELWPNHEAPATGQIVLEFIRRVPHDGGSRTDVPKEHWLDCHVDHDGHKDVYGRIAWSRPANVITSGCTNPSKGRFVHPEQDRALTPREAATLQGFPNEFVFHGKNISTQIGNAVPPPLAYQIARVLFERIQVPQVVEPTESESVAAR